MRRRLLLTAACRLCGSTQLKKDAVALECTGCGAIRPRRSTDARIVAAIAGWAEECPLSPQELGALRGILAGLTYGQIAQQQGRSPSTIRTHLHNVYEKLDVPSGVQACLVAHEQGWLREDEDGKDGRS